MIDPPMVASVKLHSNSSNPETDPKPLEHSRESRPLGRSEKEPTEYEQIVQCIKIVVETIKFYGFKGEYDPTETAKRWEKMAEGIGWIKLVKYKLAAFFSSRNHQILPTPPFSLEIKDLPHVLLGGRAGRFIDLYLKRHDEMGRMSLLFSILQSKKGMPRIGTSGLKWAEYETAVKLSKPPKETTRRFLVPWSDETFKNIHVESVLTISTVKEQLRRTVREIFKDTPALTDDERMKVFFPSTSANYINSRSQAGAVGYIMKDPDLLKGLRRPGGYIKIIHPTTTTKSEETKDVNYPEFKENTEALGFAFSALWLNLLKEAKTEEPIAVPVGLPEALKTRVITKMPPAQQTVVRCIWKKMHSVMRTQNTFKVIGEPINESIVNSSLGSLAKGQIFLSGDYAAATDNLKGWVSETIADEVSLLFKLHPEERRLFKQSLTKHIIETEDPETFQVLNRDKKRFLHFKQRTGQLMGSVTSFPILCIANAAMTRWAYELDNMRRCYLSNCPLMINGDDIALKTTLRGYKYWQTLTSSIGLEESLGKTFTSNKFVQMNSMNYLYDEEGTHPVIQKDLSIVSEKYQYREVKYINIGLVTGQKRSGIIGLNDQGDPRSTIGARYREMLRLSAREMHNEAHKSFILFNQQLLTQYNIPWHMPEWIGGLGLTGHKDPTEKDRRIAQRILFNWKSKRPINIGRSEIAWQTWLEASKSLPEPNYTENKEDPGVQERNRQMGDACVNLLFDSDYKLSDIFKGPEIEAKREKEAVKLCEKRHKGRFENSKEKKLRWTPCKHCVAFIATKKYVTALKHNEKLWKPASDSKSKLLPQPISLEKLKTLNIYETTTIKCETKDVIINEDYFSDNNTQMYTPSEGLPISSI
jgi:hypothetical protein